MLPEDITKKLLDYGLSEKEAKVLVTLGMLGQTKASTVARRLGISRMEAYRVLKKLADQGFVELSVERPIKFSVAPVEKVIDALIQAERKKLENMVKERESLLYMWQRLCAKEVVPVEHKFRILQGREQVYDLMVRMCETANEEICIITTHNDLIRLNLFGFDEVLKDSHKKGVKIKILSEISKANLEACERFIEFSELKHLPLPAIGRMVIVDGRESLTSIAFDDSMSLTTDMDVGLWTDGKQYALLMKRLFEETLVSSVPAKVVVAKIKSGKEIEEIRTIRSELEYEKNLKEMIVRSKKSVFFVMTAEVIHNLKDVAELLKSKLERGVKVKTLVKVGDEVNESMLLLSQIGDARVTNQISGIDFLIADGETAILAHKSEAAGVYGVWTNIKPHVRSLEKLLEKPWEDARNLTEVLSEIQIKIKHSLLLKEICEYLAEEGWVCKIDEVVVGVSGLQYKFDLVASKISSSKKIILKVYEAKDKVTTKMLSQFFFSLLDLSSEYITYLITIPDMDEQAKTLAKTYGVEVVSAKDGSEAINLLKKKMHDF
jgi:sugar-specific transcriptional regulator TrmB